MMGKELDQLTRELKSDRQMGLSGGERAARLELDGPNKLEAKNKTKPLMLFLSQFADTMVLMLLAATLVSAILAEYADAVTIMIIVILNACLGFFQEYKAERSLEALQNLSAPKAQILSNGDVKSVPAEELVRGDIVFLKAGDRVLATMVSPWQRIMSFCLPMISM